MSANPEPHCRIGKVRFRNGTELRVVEKWGKPARAAEFRKKIVEHAEFFAREWPRMAGYVQMVWDAEGDWSLAYRCATGITSDLPRFVADRLRERLTTNETITELNRQNGHPPPPPAG